MEPRNPTPEAFRWFFTIPEKLALEMMEKHPIEDGAFWMARTVDSRHIGNEESRNAPGTSEEKYEAGREIRQRTATPESPVV
jgi:hypothetical protein